MLTKEDIVRMTFESNLQQAHRENVGTESELFIADGFLEPRKLNVYFSKFRDKDRDLEKEYPWGAYVTPWYFFHKGKLLTGAPVYSDAFADSGYSETARRQMRIARTLENVQEFVGHWRAVTNAGSH